MPIATWLDGLKKEWGFVEKPETPEEKEEDEPVDEGGKEISSEMVEVELTEAVTVSARMIDQKTAGVGCRSKLKC